MNEFAPGLRHRDSREFSRPTPERRETSPATIAEQCADVARQYGPEALRTMLTSMQKALDEGRSVTAVELLEPIEHKTPRSEAQKEVLGILETAGIIERRTDGVLIVDDAKLFTEFNQASIRELGKDVTPAINYLGQSRLERLGNTFAGKKTILKSEFEQNPGTKPKAFFYLPEYREDALNIEQIRQSEFHFGLWEVPAGTLGTETAAATRQPASVTDLGFLEASIPALLYHPNYGDAKRDKNGRLLVKTNGEYHPLSRKWLNEVGGLKFSHKGTPNAMDSRAIEIISQYAPEILKKGLLTETDFGKEAQGRQTAETVRVSSSGTVQIDSIRHYIGRQFKNRNIRIDKLGNGQAAIVELDENGVGTPRSIMNVLERGNSNLKESKTNTSSFFEAGGKLTNVRGMPETGLEGYKAFLDFDNKLRQETDNTLFELSEDQRQPFMSAPELIKKNREPFASLIGLAGKDGLEIIGALLDNAEICERVVNTALALPAQERSTVLPLLREASLARRDALQSLDGAKTAGKIKDLDYRKMIFEINRRLTSLLTAAEDAGKVRESRSENEQANATAKLAEQGHELVLFTTIFKDSFKGTQEMSFEDMKGVETEIRAPSEINEQTKEQMLSIFEANWQGQKPELIEGLRKGFLAKLNDNGNSTQFHILEKDGRVIAFVRFDTRSDLGKNAVYGGSLNVDPAMRGSAVGEAMMRATIDTTAKDNVIYADVFPDLMVGTKYVEDLGCVITGIEEVMLDQGKTAKRFTLKRDDKENVGYGRPNKNDLTFSFDTNKETANMLATVEQETNNGNVVTRYYADPKNPNLRTLVFEPRVELAKQLKEAA